MPDVYKFLDNFNWKPDDMERLLLWNQMGGNPYDNAKRWMRANPASRRVLAEVTGQDLLKDTLSRFRGACL